MLFFYETKTFEHTTRRFKTKILNYNTSPLKYCNNVNNRRKNTIRIIFRMGQYHDIRPRNPFIIYHPIRVPLRRLHFLQAGTRVFRPVQDSLDH